MASAYGTRYGASFEPFQNTIAVGSRSPEARRDLRTGQRPKLLYVGSIFENAQLASLIDCACAVGVLAERGFPAELTIASPTRHGDRFRHLLEINPAVRVEGPLVDDEVFFRRIREADLLLLPVGFDSATVEFIRYSMPTKVPAYLVSGTPILAYGPAGVAQIDYARREGWALVVDREGVEPLADAMQMSLADVDLRQQLVRHALDTAMQNHDATVVRQRFQSRLRDAVHARTGTAMAAAASGNA
jgi:hypothetical protein